MRDEINVNLVIEEMSNWLDENLGNSQFSNLVLRWQGMLMGIDDMNAYPSSGDVFGDLDIEDPFKENENE